MGLFKKLKSVVKGVAKVAVKTAPIWTNFVPVGGSFINTALQKVAPLMDKKRAIGAVGGALLRKGVSTQRMSTVAGGINLYQTAMRGAGEQAAIDSTADLTSHGGIRGPVPSHWGPKHRLPMMARRGPARRRSRSAPRRTYRRRATVRGARGGRNRFGQFVRGRRRRTLRAA